MFATRSSVSRSRSRGMTVGAAPLGSPANSRCESPHLQSSAVQIRIFGSPEDAFVAAAGSCLAVTIAAVAEQQQLPLHDLSVQAEGFVGRRADGRFGFVRIEQTVRLQTDIDHDSTFALLGLG